MRDERREEEADGHEGRREADAPTLTEEKKAGDLRDKFEISLQGRGIFTRLLLFCSSLLLTCVAQIRSPLLLMLPPPLLGGC